MRAPELFAASVLALSKNNQTWGYEPKWHLKWGKRWRNNQFWGYLCCCFVSPYSLSKLSTIPREMRVALVGMQVAEHESESVGQKYICSLFVHKIIPSNCWRHAAFDHKRSINHLKTQLHHSVPIVFEIVFADNIFCSKPNQVGFITPYVPPSPLTSPFCTYIYMYYII